MSIGYIVILTYFKIVKSTHATDKMNALIIVIGLYPIETTKSKRKSGGIAPTAF